MQDIQVSIAMLLGHDVKHTLHRSFDRRHTLYNVWIFLHNLETRRERIDNENLVFLGKFGKLLEWLFDQQGNNKVRISDIVRIEGGNDIFILVRRQVHHIQHDINSLTLQFFQCHQYSFIELYEFEHLVFFLATLFDIEL